MTNLLRYVKHRLIERNLWPPEWLDPILTWGGAVIARSRLYVRVQRADGSIEDLGLVGTKVVTTEWVNHLVDELQSADATFNNYKYHASGTNSAAEAVGDTTSTFTSPDTPVAGTQTEGASANIYRSVGTIAYTGSKAVVEHGLANNAVWATGKLMDRTVFSVINVENGDSIEFTYELTVSAGG